VTVIPAAKSPHPSPPPGFPGLGCKAGQGQGKGGATPRCRAAVEHAVAALPNLAGHSPTMDTRNALVLAAKVEAQNLGVMKTWHPPKPTHEVWAARHGMID
jgi:hypothetical protein